MKLRHPARAGAVAVALTIVAACGSTGTSESASDYPSDDIRLVTPYDAGGPTDLTARAFGKFLEKELGQTVVVENLPGGSGAVGTQEVVAAKPDGYTVGLVTSGTAVLTPLQTDTGYTAEDLTTLGIMSEVSSMIVVRADSPYQDAQSFFKYAKANPGELNIGVPGASTPQAIELERLKDEYGIEVTVVPFDGNSEMMTALLGGNVDGLLINSSEDVTVNLDNGKFTALAVGSKEREPWLPEVPTLAELGYDSLTQSGSVYGLGAPADLPDDIATELEDALRKANEDPQVIKAVGDRYMLDTFGDGEALRAEFNETQRVYEPILGD